MLTLTKKTEYALIATCHLAHVGRGVVSACDMAKLYGVRVPLLMNVLKMLNHAGILWSLRGMRGGYGLTTGPHRITLAQLIDAVEGPPRLVKCAAPQPEDPRCLLAGKCPVSSPLGKVDRLFTRFLKGVTVADVAFDRTYLRIKPKRAPSKTKKKKTSRVKKTTGRVRKKTSRVKKTRKKAVA
jgi:Rrf2 family protein